MKLLYGFSLVLILLLPTWTSAAEYHGLIEPHRVFKIGSPQPGVLATVEVDRGDFVKKGQVIATLQSGVERAAMEVARYKAQMEAGIKGKEAHFSFFGRNKERIENLHKKEFAAQSELDEAETNRIMSEMQMKEAQENKELARCEYKHAAEIVDRMTIRSPMDGLVAERFLSPGEYVENDPIVTLAEIDPLNVEIIMPASELMSVTVGMHATVIPEAPFNESFTAEVKIVDKIVDAASGTFGVRLELKNPGNRLPSGLKSKVIFTDK